MRLIVIILKLKVTFNQIMKKHFALSTFEDS